MSFPSIPPSRRADGYSLVDVIGKDRAVLRRVEEWISDETYAGSVCGYGVLERHRPYLNGEMSRRPTYTDMMLFMSSMLKKDIRYLEIGVSVGKNFLVAADFFHDSFLAGFDIERINPVLRGFFREERVLEEWETQAFSPKKTASTLAEFRYAPRNNRIRYLCADLMDPASWERLKGETFNLIFSDAVHSPHAVLHEFRMIERCGLLDRDEFILVWDDLSGPMVMAFDEIWDMLRGRGAIRRVLSLNGWFGDHEPAHRVGFILQPGT